MDLTKFSEKLETLIEQARAWREINKSTHLAHSYAERYCRGGLGKNVWHLLVEDAWKLRTLMEEGKLVETKNAK